jgi:hypothetical protein
MAGLRLVLLEGLPLQRRVSRGAAPFLSSSLRSTPAVGPALDASDARLALLVDLAAATPPSISDPAGVRLALLFLSSAEWPALDAPDAELRLDTSDADPLALLNELPSEALPGTADPDGVRLALLSSTEWLALDASDAELRLDTSDPA